MSRPSLAWALTLALLGGAGGCGSESNGARPAAGPDGARAAPQTGELLLAQPPAGWVEVTSLNRGQVRIVEYAAPDTLSPDRLDLLRFESQGSLPLPDPIEIAGAMSAEMAGLCQGFEDFPIHSGFENGYPTSVRLLTCQAYGEPVRGEIRMTKAIRGSEQFYIVTRIRRTAPFEGDAVPVSVEEMAEWSGYFSRVSLCDTRDAAHPCPGAADTGDRD